MSGVRLGAGQAADALLATHGTTLGGLTRLLFGPREPGNLILPSIALTRADAPLPRFGDVALVIDPSVVQPGPNVRIFGADAWTPRVPYQEADKFTFSPQFQRFEQDRIADALRRFITSPEGISNPGARRLAEDLLSRNIRDIRSVYSRDINRSTLSESILAEYLRNIPPDIDHLMFLRSPHAQEYRRIITGMQNPADARYLPLRPDGSMVDPLSQSYIMQRPFSEDLDFVRQNTGIRLGEVNGNINTGVLGQIRAAIAPEYTTPNFADLIRNSLEGAGTAGRPRMGETLLGYFRNFPQTEHDFVDLVRHGSYLTPVTRADAIAGRNAPNFPENLMQQMLHRLSNYRGGARGQFRQAINMEQNAVAPLAEVKIEGLLPLNPNTVRAILARRTSLGAIDSAAEAQALFREFGMDVPIAQDRNSLRRWMFGTTGAAGLGAGAAQAQDLPPEIVQQALAAAPRGDAVTWGQRVTRGNIADWLADAEARAEAEAGQAAALGVLARRFGGIRTQPEEAARMAAEQAAETRAHAAEFPGGLAGLGAWRLADLVTPIPLISRLFGYNPDPGDDTPFWADALGAGLWALPGAMIARRALQRGLSPNNARNMVRQPTSGE
jgi:hypothetical protein